MSIASIVNSGRRLVATTLLDRARIQDRSIVRDATGGKKEVWLERSKSTRCRFVRPKDDEPTAQLDSVYGPTEMFLLLPLGTLYVEGDRVRNMSDDVLYVITLDLTPPSALQVVRRVGIRTVD